MNGMTIHCYGNVAIDRSKLCFNDAGAIVPRFGEDHVYIDLVIASSDNLEFPTGRDVESDGCSSGDANYRLVREVGSVRDGSAFAGRNIKSVAEVFHEKPLMMAGREKPKSIIGRFLSTLGVR